MRCLAGALAVGLGASWNAIFAEERPGIAEERPGWAEERPGCDGPLYKEAGAPMEQRVEDLLGRLTLEEKVSLLEYNSPAIPRLGIEEYNWWNEALHGVGRSGTATVFPQAIGMAASWDDSLLLEVFTAVSDEARAKNTDYRHRNQREIYQGLSFWTPNINIFRDPRWGRGQETYGEDPYLTSRMGQAVVRGLQGDDSTYVKNLACAKHFAVHSGPEWSRHQINVDNVSDRDLLETYLPAFKDLVTKADVRQVMCAYNRLKGVPCCGSPYLLQDVLRDQWHYPYIVVSDCWAISDFHHEDQHNVDKTPVDAGARALMAGTDLECGQTYGTLMEALDQGLVSEEEVDRALRRNLTQRFALGEFDPESQVKWTQIPLSVVGSDAHKALALKIAQESLVLLKNDGVLPLNPNQKIALIGPNANDSIMQWGNYNGFPTHTVTLKEALDKKVPSLVYDSICGHTQPIDLDSAFANFPFEGCDVVIFAGGISPMLEGEEMPVKIPGFRGGDREDISLPQVQQDVLRLLKEVGKKVVLVNFSGSAIALDPSLYDAMVQAWYPGEQGGEAVAQTLMGEYNPAGRLPVTFYKEGEALPDFEDYSMRGRTYRYHEGEVEYPFGFGLSYSAFEYGEPTATGSLSDGVDVTVPVTNVSARDGEEVVQVYLKRNEDADGPIKTLRGFKRVSIPAGATQQVGIHLAPDDLLTFDEEEYTMALVPGRYTIYVGPNSASFQTLPIEFTTETRRD